MLTWLFCFVAFAVFHLAAPHQSEEISFRVEEWKHLLTMKPELGLPICSLDAYEDIKTLYGTPFLFIALVLDGCDPAFRSEKLIFSNDGCRGRHRRLSASAITLYNIKKPSHYQQKAKDIIAQLSDADDLEGQQGWALEVLIKLARPIPEIGEISVHPGFMPWSTPIDTTSKLATKGATSKREHKTTKRSYTHISPFTGVGVSGPSAKRAKINKASSEIDEFLQPEDLDGSTGTYSLHWLDQPPINSDLPDNDNHGVDSSVDYIDLETDEFLQPGDLDGSTGTYPLHWPGQPPINSDLPDNDNHGVDSSIDYTDLEMDEFLLSGNLDGMTDASSYPVPPEYTNIPDSLTYNCDADGVSASTNVRGCPVETVQLFPLGKSAGPLRFTNFPKIFTSAPRVVDLSTGADVESSFSESYLKSLNADKFVLKRVEELKTMIASKTGIQMCKDRDYRAIENLYKKPFLIVAVILDGCDPQSKEMSFSYDSCSVHRVGLRQALRSLYATNSPSIFHLKARAIIAQLSQKDHVITQERWAYDILVPAARPVPSKGGTFKPPGYMNWFEDSNARNGAITDVS